MLRIDRATYDAIVAHAREDHPDEACGVVAGPEGSDRPERFVPMLNAARSPTFYEFDSGDLLRLYRELDDRDEEPVIIYHSHTATEAYPSRTDISYANEPGAHYVLVSTADTDGLGEFQFRSFRIVEGEVTEEEVTVGKAQRETGRARLRKYVVTENVQTTVPVQHEEVRVEREPITDGNVDAATDGPDISEGAHEVVLHEEQPVVEKKVVPKERVRLDTEAVTEEREVSEQARKEQIELEGESDADRRS